MVDLAPACATDYSGRWAAAEVHTVSFTELSYYIDILFIRFVYCTSQRWENLRRYFQFGLILVNTETNP